jgi:hypothetical protein
MDGIVFHTLARRGSLVSVGAAGLAALAKPITAGGKKKNKKKKGDVNTLCKQEVNDCLVTLTAACEDAPCVAAVQLCCPKLATCDFTGLINCIQDNGA